jgi:hypothetical protein
MEACGKYFPIKDSAAWPFRTTALAFADEEMKRSAADANMILFIDFTLRD